MRSWLVVPTMAIVGGGAAIALGLGPDVALLAAALAAVVRALGGDSPAALAGAVLAPILAIASIADPGAGGGAEAPVRAVLALAAAGWSIAELARSTADAAAPAATIRATLAAAVAAILDPSFVALVAIAGVGLPTTARAHRAWWALAAPATGALAIALAAVAGTRWPAFGAAWFGRAAHPIDARALAILVAGALGPLTSVAALAGLAALVRPRHAELAFAAAVAGALLGDLRAGATGCATIGLAAALAGLAITRLARTIRIPAGQAIAGAAIGALLIIPPAWTAVDQRAAGAHTGHASR